MRFGPLRSIVQQTGFFQRAPERRLPPLDGICNTLRSSYRSGFRLFSQFVPLAKKDALDNSNNNNTTNNNTTNTTNNSTTITTTNTTNCSSVPYRFLTPRECARLQGFPDKFKLSGVNDGVNKDCVGDGGGGGGSGDGGGGGGGVVDNNNNSNNNSNNSINSNNNNNNNQPRGKGVIPEAAQYHAIGNADT